MIDSMWFSLYRRFARAELGAFEKEPEGLLKKVGEILDGACHPPVGMDTSMQSWRAMKLTLEDDGLTLSFQVSEFAGRLNSPREVTMVFLVGNLSSSMLAVWEVMET